MAVPELTVVIGSYLEPEQADRIAAAPGVRLLYEPELLPVPRYPSDHTGRATASCSGAGLARVAGASPLRRTCSSISTGWSREIDASRCPDLRWIQATSAGIGGFMERTGLSGSGLTVTTAAGIHAVPLAEFAVAGALYFVKGLPRLRQRQDARHWERYATRRLRGRRALVAGLGGIGRAVAASFGCLGVEVWGLGRDGGSYDDARRGQADHPVAARCRAA